MIFSYLNYGNLIWGEAVKRVLNCLHLSQKRFVRLATNSEYRAHSEPLFFQLKIITIYDIFNINRSEFVYKWKNNMNGFQLIYPNYYKEFRQQHRYDTTHQRMYIKPKIKNNYGKKMMTFSGIVQWESIPNEIKCSKSLNILKSKLKKFYINRYNH